MHVCVRLHFNSFKHLMCRHTHTHVLLQFRDYSSNLILSSLYSFISSSPFVPSASPSLPRWLLFSFLYYFLVIFLYYSFSSVNTLSSLPSSFFPNLISPLCLSSFVLSSVCYFSSLILHPPTPSQEHLLIMKHTVGRRPRLAPPPRYLLQRLPPAKPVCLTSSAPPCDLLSLPPPPPPDVIDLGSGSQQRWIKARLHKAPGQTVCVILARVNIYGGENQCDGWRLGHLQVLIIE